MRTQQGGFTLVELIIVFAIIAVLASISIPNLIESKKRAYEQGAVMTLRSIAAAQEIFRERDLDKNGLRDFARDIRALGPRTAGGCGILSSFRGVNPETFQGYLFRILDPLAGDAGGVNTYRALAVPMAPGKSGDRSFAVDESGVIRATFDPVSISSELDISGWAPVGE